jgi:hypothetical protein
MRVKSRAHTHTHTHTKDAHPITSKCTQIDETPHTRISTHRQVVGPQGAELHEAVEEDDEG